MATLRRHKCWPIAVLLKLSTAVCLVILYFRFSLSFNKTSSPLSNLRFIPFIKNVTQAGTNGSRANHSIPEVDVFVKMFQSRHHNSTNKLFDLKSEEPYNVFLRRLNLKKKKGKMLMDETAEAPNNSIGRFIRGINEHFMYDPNDERVTEDLLRDISTLPIVSAEKSQSGSQLKINVLFSDGSSGRFKPIRMPKEAETPPDVFHFRDFERARAEIAGFHLDRVLGFYRAVPTVGRVLNMSRDLATFFKQEKSVAFVYTSPAGNLCFVAKCDEFCGADYPFCGHPDVLEGSISAMIPTKSPHNLLFLGSPYGRPWWEDAEKASWLNDENYCNKELKKNTPLNGSHSLLNLIDLSILDFFTGNLDRHNIETYEKLGPDSFIPFIDNGRGFGRTSYDLMSGLAPVSQCCLIRLSTLAKLIKLYQGPDSLSQVMRKSLMSDPLSPVLIEPNLDALDRRLGKVIKAVSDCINNGRSWEDVVINDGFV